MHCSTFVPASLSCPNPIPSAHTSLRWGQLAEEPGKQSADKLGSGPPITGSQCQNLPNCGHRGETVGHSACQGRGPEDRVCGELRVSPLGVCAAQMMGALSLCPCGYHLPCCLAAVSVPGLGLMVHPWWTRIQGHTCPAKPRQRSTAWVPCGEALRGLLPCLAFPRKIKISS